MKLLTLWQPYATAIAIGLKRYETRHWATEYRGKIAIHAAKRRMKAEELYQLKKELEPFKIDINHFFATARQQMGSIVAICDLVDCIEMDKVLISEQPELEIALGNWERGRYAFSFKNIKAIAPIPCRGSQSLIDVKEDILNKINSIEPKKNLTILDLQRKATINNAS